MTERTSVAVVFGGRSNEHAVSCVSAAAVVEHLDSSRYQVLPIGITRAGTWRVVQPDQLSAPTGELPTVPDTGPEVTVSVDPSQDHALLVHTPTHQVQEQVDVVFPVLHGPFGEDGTFQGLLEMADLPYVGSGVLASAVGMDKEFTKKLLAAEGLPSGPYLVLYPGQATLTPEQREKVGLPIFVKPARGGSSVGISRVSAWSDLDAALRTARQHDPKLVVEAEIPGREIECAVLEFPDGRVVASSPAEIRLPSADGAAADFYDYRTKYLAEVCEFDVPAKVEDETREAIRDMAVRAFRALNCQGLARVDFFLTAEGPVINEINTMPGFTPISLYPRMWEASGLDYRTVLHTLIETALARGTGLR